MHFNEVIKERRSVRTFLEKDVSQELIHKILEYGHLAPSAGNIQPWEFIIIRDSENKMNIVNTTFIGNNEKNGKAQEWLVNAPVFIIICTNKDRSFNRYGHKTIKTLMYLDSSACIENMLLGAVNLGLASCYVSGFRIEELTKVLNLPKSHEPIAILPIGYSKEICFKRPGIELEEIIHYETF